MPELGRETDGGPKQRRRRDPHDLHGQQMRHRPLDLSDVHLPAPESLPPRIRGLDCHQVGRQEHRFSFEQPRSSSTVRLVREPDSSHRGVDDDGAASHVVANFSLAHPGPAAAGRRAGRHRSRSSLMRSTLLTVDGRCLARIAAASAAISFRLSFVPSVSRRRASCSNDVPRSRAWSFKRSATSSSRLRTMIVAMS